ncbi:MAG: ADP-ribosylglycohydrolase family protein [Clostridiales bacterium]|nr:ADP-ribosylglycohydrolase family protein [Clostridiales bacterium]
MYGAVFGDIIGSSYEWHNVKREDFDLFPKDARFTDDTVLTVAVAESILNMDVSSPRKCYAQHIKAYYRRYPHAGFGNMFINWAESDSLSVQKSYGNGASMRVSAIGWAFNDEETIRKQVSESCYYTHHNKEAIQCAQAVALAVFFARKDMEKKEIRKRLEEEFKLEFLPLDDIRDGYQFDSRSIYSVPPAIEAFFESEDYESSIRKAISIGGDSDTIAAIAGSIAEAYYREIPKHIQDKGKLILDSGLKRVLNQFEEKYQSKN